MGEMLAIWNKMIEENPMLVSFEMYMADCFNIFALVSTLQSSNLRRERIGNLLMNRPLFIIFMIFKQIKKGQYLWFIKRCLRLQFGVYHN